MDFGDVKHYWRAAQHKTMEKSAKNTCKVDILAQHPMKPMTQ